MKWLKRDLILMGVVLSIPLFLIACDSIIPPSLENVKQMAEAEREFQGGLQEATVTTMTEQHTAMTPELEAVFATILAQNAELNASLRSLAADKVSAVKGPQIGGIEGALGGGMIPSLLSMFGLGSLIPLYNMFFGKSRAQSEIDELKLKLATRAGEKDDGL